MNIDIFRNDLLRRISEKKRSLLSLSSEYGVQQASLFRFVKKKKGISGAYVLALWPFVYPDNATSPPDSPVADTPQALSAKPAEEIAPEGGGHE